jgi:hypothetical protein
LLIFIPISETKCSSLARSDLENQKNPINNETGNSSTDIVHQQEAISNGDPKTVVPPMATISTPVVPGDAVAENGETKLKMEKEL